MKTIRLFIFSLLAVGVISCKENTKLPEEAVEPVVTTFYLIRHAEKDLSNADNIDPELTQKGLGRAMHWAEILDDVSLDAIYSTDYERTSQTAAPAAVKQDVIVTFHNPMDLDIEQFKIDNLGNDVLVVGHSNTTPDLVNRLIGEEKYLQLDESEYGHLFIVQVIGDKTTDTHLEFNCNCPE